MNSRRVILKHLAIGFVVGMIISIAPIELAILLVPGLLVVWVLAVRRRPPGFGLTSYIIAVVVALLAIGIAILLPLKHLDRKVGPIRYARMSLDALCHALSKDYRVFAGAPYPQGTNIFLEFHTDRVMTRREVLQKLAEDTECDLHIGYCGSGATFLFGSHPSFTRLDVKLAQPDGAANRSQPIRPEINRASAAAGSGR